MIRRKSTFAWAQKHAADNPDIRSALALPMIKPILDCIDEHRAARFFVLMPPQVGKSLIGQLRFMRSKQVEPRNSLWYREAKEQLEGFAAEKFNPLFDRCAPLRPLLLSDRNKRKTLSAIYADDTSMAMLSANTKGNRQSRTACDIYFDESWLYGPGWVDEISKRRSSPAYAHDWREIHMSTGPTADSEADQVWQSSDQQTWHVRCPACDQLFFPARTHHDDKTGERIGGLVFETVLKADGMPDEAAIAASTVYKCPHCKTVLPNTDATRAAMNLRGEYVRMNPSAAPRTFGFHVHFIALKDWSELAIKMVKATIAKSRAGDLTVLEEVIRKYDAARWDPELYHRPEKFATYQHPQPYKMEEPWEGVIKDAFGKPLLIATVDVQIDHFFLIIRKWGKFSQSRLHLAARCMSLAEVALHLTRAEVPPERVALDTRFDTQRVRTYCARMGWRTMMGDKSMKDYPHPDGLKRIYDKAECKDAFTGTVLQSAAGSYVIETLFSKNSALNRLAALRDPDSKAPDGSPLWTAAADAPDWYFKQINAHFRKRIDNPDQSHHFVWHGQKDDHADDCEAMGVVVASALGLTGAESMEPPEK